MNTLKRNQQVFYFKNYIGEQPILDSDGNETGEYTKTFGNLTEGKANISPNAGTVNPDMFGADISYSNVMCMDNCPFNEHSVLWVGISTNDPFNYVVKRISKSLNSYLIAIENV